MYKCSPRVLLVLAALVVLLVLVVPPAREAFAEEDTIFVSIASYRDSLCSDTIDEIFSKARHPERVFVGVCEQNTKSSEESCTRPEYEHSDNIRSIKIPYKEAKGPTYARYLCSTLYRGETYFMQLDSHMMFVDDWDVKVIGQHAKCPTQKAVLSTYPLDFENFENHGETGVPHLCKSAFNDDGILQFEAVIKDFPVPKKPLPIPFASGGFLFGPGSLVTDVPFDPALDHLFQGEEILYSARLWTNGYDMYSPMTNIVFHKYTRKDEPKFWDEDNERQRGQSVAKVKRLFEGKIKAYAHGFGTERSLSDYWKFAKVDMAKKSSASEKKFCG